MSLTERSALCTADGSRLVADKMELDADGNTLMAPPVTLASAARPSRRWAAAGFFLLGLSSWLAINGAFASLPVFGPALPEGYAIASSLTLAVQIANIVPLCIFLVRLLLPHARFVSALRDHRLIAGVLALSTASCVLLGVFWDWTTNGQSVALLLLVLVMGAVDCTSTICFWPYVRAYAAACKLSDSHFRTLLVTLSLGESTCGLLVALLGAAQTLNVPYGVGPRFSTLTFFLCLAAISCVSAAAFAALEVTRRRSLAVFAPSTPQLPAAPASVSVSSAGAGAAAGGDLEAQCDAPAELAVCLRSPSEPSTPLTAGVDGANRAVGLGTATPSSIHGAADPEAVYLSHVLVQTDAEPAVAAAPSAPEVAAAASSASAAATAAPAEEAPAAASTLTWSSVRSVVHASAAPLVALWLLNFWENGAFVSILPNGTVPFGANVYRWATYAPLAGAALAVALLHVGSAAQRWVSRRSALALCTLLASLCMVGVLVPAAGAVSHAGSGAMRALVVLNATLFKVVVALGKTGAFLALGHTSTALFMGGLATQAGSLCGALVFYALTHATNSFVDAN